MAKRTCSIDDCGGAHYCRGWCEKHYNRWRKWGDPLKTLIFYGSAEDRFWHYVEKRGPDECWPWTGTITEFGYGVLKDAGQQVRAHIKGYLLTGHTIPQGLVLDHTCHDPKKCVPGPDCPHRRCCNPSHLEPVTLGENTLRGGGRSAENARLTKCQRGHDLDEANTSWRSRKRPDGTSWARVCRTCARDQQRERRAARRAVQAAILSRSDTSAL